VTVYSHESTYQPCEIDIQNSRMNFICRLETEFI